MGRRGINGVWELMRSHLHHIKNDSEMEKRKYKCCICGTEQEGIGYDTYGYYNEHRDDRCCRKCHWKYVLPILKVEKKHLYYR